MKLYSILLTLLLSSAVAAADDGWILRVDGECADYTGAAAANGTMGILHWKEPFSVRQIVLNNVFELNDITKVNCAVLGPNPFEITMTVDGKGIDNYTHWSQSIDMKNAEHITSFRLSDKIDVSYSMIALRNLSHAAIFKVTVKASEDASVAFGKSVSLPDGYQQPRSYNKDIFVEGRSLKIQQTDALTTHGRYDVSAASMFIYDETKGRLHSDEEKAVLTFDMSAGETVEFVIVGSICSTAEYSDPYSEALRELVYVDRLGVDKIISGHRRLWDKLWESDIIIEGDTQAQLLIRFALYNLYSSCRKGTRSSVPPMGLSSQGYNGHIFWDTELWMYPPMLLLNQGIAKSMIDYRVDRMEPARRRASDYGYQGLMFPWESDSFGQESTPVWAITGPMEHHVTADVGIAAWNYYLVTGDKVWLRQEGWSLLRGVAEFWISRVEENADGTYSINGVVGADEYAQNVNDNAFTNASAKVALLNAAKAAETLGYDVPEKWTKVAEGLRVLYNEEGVIMEYDGYDGRMIKQADVNLLAFPLGIITDPAQIRRDLSYYEDKIDMVNGPAMTFSIFAILYARMGDKGKATEMFRRAYEPNIRPPFGVFAETPTSQNPYFMTGAGGLLQAVLFGFGGISITDEGIVQGAAMLPEGWSRMEIKGVGPAKKTFVVENY